MDELTLLRSTRDDTLTPSPTTLATGRAALLDRAANASIPTTTPQRAKHHILPRLTWAGAGVAAAIIAILVAGNVNMSAQAAHASDILRTAAVQTIDYANLVPGSDQYLRSRTHARWQACETSDSKTGGIVCTPNDQILDVYMPADPAAEWVLYRDWGNERGMYTDASIETLRAVDGEFYGPGSPWVRVDYAEIPLDGAAAYAWIDAQYTGGSASRDEDNYERITDMLRSGLVPAAQRAALLDALSRIPGVTATDDVANLDDVTGIAIGRNEPVRAGERQEIILDPETGLVIGERTLGGAGFLGWGVDQVVELTAIETTVVDKAP